jgi:hypothetical protein
LEAATIQKVAHHQNELEKKEILDYDDDSSKTRRYEHSRVPLRVWIS